MSQENINQPNTNTIINNEQHYNTSLKNMKYNNNNNNNNNIDIDEELYKIKNLSINSSR